MDSIRLDPRKLLGFKIIADGESTVRLTSPKIGDKACAVFGDDVTRQQVAHATLRAKIGSKTDITVD